MAVKNFDKKLNAILSNKKSNWKGKAEWRLKNKHWLKHSRRVAIELNETLKERKMTQKQLAELLNVSPAQISKIMKGQENFTFETISKLEQALGINLIFQEENPKEEIIIQFFHKSYSTSKPTLFTPNYKENEYIKGISKFSQAVCIN